MLALSESAMLPNGRLARSQNMITENIQLILVTTGMLTTGAIGFFLFPRLLLQRAFAVEEPDPALTMVTRHWGLLLSLLGALLVYAASEPGLRVSVMVVATIEKVAFAWLVFWGPLKKSGLARGAAAADSLMALLYVLFLSGL
jgi:hypothetical protein